MDQDMANTPVEGEEMTEQTGACPECHSEPCKCSEPAETEGVEAEISADTTEGAETPATEETTEE